MAETPLLFHHHFIDKLAFLNGFISGVALYPQVIKVILSGQAIGVSLSTYCLILINSIVWLAYAVHRGLISLAIASILNILASAILITSVIVFV